MSLTAVIDADYIAYAVASAGEKRTVIVTHKPSGREIEVKTRTEWHGHHLKKDGGMLAKINENRTSPFSADEFEFEDVQTPEPIENVLHSAKMMYQGASKQVEADRSVGFLGGSTNFRDDVATILQYKGNRENLIKPLYLQEVREYLVRRFHLEVVDGIEADDACIMEAYGKDDHVVVAVDKDAAGNHVKWYNPNNPEAGIVDCRKFGKLWLNAKGDVKGVGRMFFYFQCGFGDPVDAYRANSACDTAWGQKSAYKALSHCTNDKEAMEALKGIYETLYPEPKAITGWRGDEIEIDWKYVLNENWQLARMLRNLDELKSPILATDVIDKMGIEM